MPLLYFALGAVAGYLFGRRDAKAQADSSTGEILNHVGSLASTGALTSVGNLQLKSGNDQDGVQLQITTRPLAPPVHMTWPTR